MYGLMNEKYSSYYGYDAAKANIKAMDRTVKRVTRSKKAALKYLIGLINKNVTIK